MPPYIEMVDRRFGRLAVLARVDDWVGAGRSRLVRYRVRCDCGNETIVLGANLRRGLSTSCGCLRNEKTAERLLKHGDALYRNETVEYRTWCSMVRRCENPNVRNFINYGGRGISVCERWRKSFATFLKDMGRKPSQKHSIDRIDNDGDYEPSNCRWATSKEQRLNQRRSKKR